ncbi:peroxisome biogenesis protein 5 isoform X2 [Cucumis melo]|uniref:Peroxisome biogenesis protein 5 isoform X2 n=1 Tax=Cucumis melo TaxID=3656 RepID=A0A1S4DXB8_CUCME|nr:peroxisome biogenesis protein 5 isoform X2 [Cucumis melo]
MAMRDLVTGGADCAAPGSSSSNPLGALANALIGSSSKTQERLREIPTSQLTGPERPFAPETHGQLPGSEFDHPPLQPNQQASNFLNAFHSAADPGLASAWNEVQAGPPPAHLREMQPSLAEFDRIYDQVPASQHQPILDGPPQRVLSNFLHSFVESSRGGVPFHPTPLPLLGLSEGDKQCIRDRSSIMARHFFADKSEDFINAQLNALLSSLDIDTSKQVGGPQPGRFREMEDYWNESQALQRPGGHVADGWASEYSLNREKFADHDAWAQSFEQQYGANGWASEFEQERFQLGSAQKMAGGNMMNLSAMEQTRKLANTLAENNDPKFQVSNQTNRWADEFAEEKQNVSDDPWVNEFSKLHMQDWVEEFGQQVGEGVSGEADNWANAYDEFVNEQVAAKGKMDASKGIYVFSDMNPYVGHPNPLKEGQDLFRKGLLSEAVLALEAEVMKNPENSEGWRLLGIAHAENDDDQQAIAAMKRALDVDPTNLEVLLALGVSHTNELEQAAALRYLYGWLQHHPKYGTLAKPELADSLYYADVAGLFNEAAQMFPDDADVHIVLGVLYNLSREFDKAIASFQTALKLKPQDYSLWNKLGATQANSIQSADAILAYQQALDLKPNYVRAWANMGISYANQGLYEESIKYYVRSLSMNPKADNAWQYLRISLSCASRNDMLEACDSRNLDALQKEFPL